MAVLASSGMERDARLAVWAAVVLGSIGVLVFYLLCSPEPLEA